MEDSSGRSSKLNQEYAVLTGVCAAAALEGVGVSSVACCNSGCGVVVVGSVGCSGSCEKSSGESESKEMS